MSKHTKEPWVNDVPCCIAIHHPEGGKETVALFPKTEAGELRAIRAVACHNALLGLTPEAVKDVVDLAEALADSHLREPITGTVKAEVIRGRLLPKLSRTLAKLRTPTAAKPQEQ